MAQDLKPIEVSQVPALLSLAHQVRDSYVSRVLQQEDEDLALIAPLQPPKKPTRVRKGRPVKEGDALFRLIGIGSSGNTTSVARDKHGRLSDATRQNHH